MRVSWVGEHPNTPPVPRITLPSVGQLFKVGDVIQLQGSATDNEDGTIPSANLRWDLVLKHCPGFGPSCHDHPFETLTGATAQFTAPDHGDGSYFEIRLTATDSRGFTATTTRQLDPKTIEVTLNTSPPGGTVVYDGTAHTSPYTTTTLAGSTHTIGVTPPAGQQFVSWAHGGAQQQNVVVGEANVSYTATYASASSPTPVTPTPVTPIPTAGPVKPTSTCSPRPRVNMTTAIVGTGQLQVTISTTTHEGFPTNKLKSIQFQQTQNAVYEITGQPSGAGPYTVNYPDGTTQTTFIVKRTAAGTAQARFTVVDDCGTWPTLVGAGPAAGW